MKEILATNSNGCLALTSTGEIHLCFGQLYFVFSREELCSFIRFLLKTKKEMQETFGYNKIFFETGMNNLRIALSHKEIDQMTDLMNEAELSMSMKELLAS